MVLWRSEQQQQQQQQQQQLKQQQQRYSKGPVNKIYSKGKEISCSNLITRTEMKVYQ